MKQDNGHVIFNGVQIRSHIVEILKMTNQLQNHVFYDKKFIFMLMVELFEIEDLIEHRLHPLRRSIDVSNLFEIRIGTQYERMSSLETFFMDGCNYFRRMHERRQ